jgi:hypothetical protein
MNHRCGNNVRKLDDLITIPSHTDSIGGINGRDIIHDVLFDAINTGRATLIVKNIAGFAIRTETGGGPHLALEKTNVD